MAPTIMIGTQDANIAYLLQRYAEESGFQAVRVRPDGDVLAQARDLRPKLIILDIERGDLTDRQVVRQLKMEPATQRIPILICSYLDELPETLRASVDGYLGKAIMYADFVAALERAGLGQYPNDAQLEPAPTSGIVRKENE